MEETIGCAKAVLVGLLALVLLVGIEVAGWHFGWWLEEKNVDRRVGIENRNLGTQTAWRDEANHLIRTIELLPEDAPQRGGLQADACELIDRLTDNYMTDQLVAFEAVSC